jgi:hypothetical protein
MGFSSFFPNNPQVKFPRQKLLKVQAVMELYKGILICLNLTLQIAFLWIDYFMLLMRFGPSASVLNRIGAVKIELYNKEISTFRSV